MNHDLRTTLEQVRVGELSVEEATRRLAPSADLGFANVDLGRQERCGFSEVIYCAGKTPEQVVAIAAEILERSPRILLTRADQTQADAVAAAIPDAVFHNSARCITVDPEPLPREGLVAIIAAGTSDLPVAEEASVTAQIMGCDVTTHWDVGVAGLHRLVERIEAVREARVIVAIAGMEGALASVVGGLVDRPVIAVPTSVGCGLHLEGIVPLLAMLNSCAAGVAVVNVDNGFGAGYFAALINRTNAPNPPIS
jgi:NCAIR mutase (PurE)-related protein